jgi:predicted Zn-dependent protease
METKDIAKKVIAIAKGGGAEFVEVLVMRNEFSLKRIRHGQVDQPPAGEQWGIDVAVVKNGRRKTVSFDNPLFAEDTIKETLAQIDFLPQYEVYIPESSFPLVAQPDALYDSKTAELNDQYLIDIVKEVAQALSQKNLWLSGKAAQGNGEIAYENSIGTSQHAQYTAATASFFAFDKDDQFVSAFANSGGISVDHIEKDRLVKELILKCELARGKKKIDPFEGKADEEELRIDIIAEPYFFEPIFEWLGFFGFNGILVERGESFLSNKIESQVTGENISITDDPFSPQNKGMGLPFDFEGRPRETRNLIEKGIAKTAVYDSASAHTWGKQPTGNALPPSERSEGAAPFDIVVRGGDQSVEQMIKECKKPTLWITKVHYLGMKHYQTATMTGIAQHGVFLIEDGEVKGPVENLRFEESIPEALKRVDALSPSRLVFNPASFGAPSGVVLPAIKIKDFRFIGSTRRTV